ncbi:glycosyltransferase family 2 protein [Sphingorhabdus sp.]|uniref:glycosyltransferase family 2 protein n=4 Tax=Sphingorhabdus sp. TaxID=1902408 RepID=UPI003C717AB7|nr:glycosyltransferase [Sphingomonadales bacterium]
MPLLETGINSWSVTVAKMSTSPAISVIMPMYNSARYVGEAVESVLAQRFTDFEFLIVDDGSTDGSGAIIRRYAARDPRIQLFTQENSGIVASVNFLLGKSRAPYIARMDSDDICLPDRLGEQKKALDSRPELGALGTQFIEIDGEGQITDDAFRHPVGVDAIRARLLETQPVCNPSVMLRKDMVLQTGGYRPAFRYCEDYDLFLRLSRLAEIDNLNAVLFKYRRTDTQLTVRHNDRQNEQAVLARFAHNEVLAGRPDPFANVETLPTVGTLDALMGRNGIDAQLREEIVRHACYSRVALSGDQFELIRAHAASGRPFPGAWRTVLRCIRLGLPKQAALLALALIGDQVGMF